MNKVILIVIDGCRPDGLLKAKTPVIDALMNNGASSLKMQTVNPPTTLPAHISIFTSTKPVNHGVLTNAGRVDQSANAFSILDLAKYWGKSVSGFFSWNHFTTLGGPYSFDFVVSSSTGLRQDNDMIIARHAARHLIENPSDLSFIYLERTDKIGHKFKYMSDDYLFAIEMADTAIGHIVESLKSEDLLNMYHIIVQADHGGLGNQHNQLIPEVMTVPWIASGNNVKKGFGIEGEVSILDTAPTIARLLEINHHPYWEGRCLDEIFMSD
jgi:predicted AlkP superfamily pyrophosphatase or phosphodiesterase